MRIGLGLFLGMAGVGLPAPSVTLDSPVSNDILLAGKAYTVSGTCTAGTTVTVAWNAVLLGSAVVVGTNWTYAWTPTSGQEGVFDLTATATNPAGGLSTTSTAKTPLVLADAFYRVRANTAATYTQAAGALTALINEVSGVSASTAVGAPGWTADDAGSGKAAFTFNGSSAIRGTEAAVLSGFGASEKAIVGIVVCKLSSLDADASLITAADAASTHIAGFWQLSTSSGKYGFYRQGASPRIWDSENTAAGRQVVECRSTDGLTFFTRKNGGAETSETLTALTINTPTRFAVGESPSSAPGFRLTGSIHEIILLSVHKSSTIMTAIRDRLTADWI